MRAVPASQVGLMGSARELQRDLERIAARADTDSPAGLHYILQGALGGAARGRSALAKPRVMC